MCGSLRRCLSALLPDPAFRCEELPSTARVTLTETAEYALIHVKVTYPERRGEQDVIEVRTCYPAGVVVRVAGRFASAELIPSRRPLEAECSDAQTVLRLPQIDGYLCVALRKT